MLDPAHTGRNHTTTQQKAACINTDSDSASPTTSHNEITSPTHSSESPTNMEADSKVQSHNPNNELSSAYNCVRPSVLYMSWRRRIVDESHDKADSFFTMIEETGLFTVKHCGNRIYEIRPKDQGALAAGVQKQL